jgi:hypothetical protein
MKATPDNEDAMKHDIHSTDLRVGFTDRDSHARRLRHETSIRAQIHSLIDDLSITDIPLLDVELTAR